MSNSSIEVLPFYKLTDFQLQMEFETCQIRIKNILNDNGFAEFIANVTSQDAEKHMDIYKYYDIDEFNEMTHRNSFIKIQHINTRMLSKNRGKVIAYLSLFREAPEVLLLSEIGKEGYRYLDYTFPDYEYTYDIPNNNKYGGVAILIHKGIGTVKIRTDLKFRKACECHECQFENEWVEILLNGESLIIGTIYRHPNGNTHHFVDQLNTTMSKLPRDKICIMAGDININLLHYDDSHVNEYITQLLSYGFLPRITLPTRITDSTQTLIDHIFVRIPIKDSERSLISGNLYADLSDHLPVFLCLGIGKPHKPKRPWVRIYSEKNIQNFKTSMQAQEWDVIEACHTTDEKFDCFQKILTDIYEQNFPLVKLSRKRAKDKKWINNGLKVSIRHNFRLYKKQELSPTPQNKAKYKQYKSKLDASIKRAQELYYSKLFQENRDSAIKMWRTLGGILNPGKKHKKSHIDKLIIDNYTLKGDKEMVDAMNTYFCKVGETLAGKLPKGKKFRQFLGPKIEETIFMNPTEEHEILSEIKRMNPRKSPGPDNVSPKILQACAPAILRPLAHLVNHAFESAVCPSDLKLAKVMALY